MKRKCFPIEQIVAVLKQAELGMPVADLIRQVGISEQTFYRWKKRYAGMQSDQVHELKQLQDGNARLKKLVAELSLDKAILQDVASKVARPALRRDVVDYVDRLLPPDGLAKEPQVWVAPRGYTSYGSAAKFYHPSSQPATSALTYEVSGKVEYDNKGQPVRSYQPYFIDDW
ncbi:transposase, partial [Burkholderia sp. MSMB1498]